MKFVSIAIDPSKRWSYPDGSSDYSEATLYGLASDGSVWALSDPSGYHEDTSRSWRRVPTPAAFHAPATFDTTEPITPETS